MATLNQIIGILSERVGRPFDVPFQEELKVIVKYWGIRLLKNSLNQKILDRKYFYTQIIVPIIKVNQVTCPVNYGCAWRSESKIPTPLRVNNVLFDYVGSADFSAPFAYRLNWQMSYMRESKFTSHFKSYYYADGYLWFNDILGQQQAGVLFIPADPNELITFCRAGGIINTCPDDEFDEYPLNPDLLQQLISSILKTELANMLQTGEEKVNMDADNKN